MKISNSVGYTNMLLLASSVFVPTGIAWGATPVGIANVIGAESWQQLEKVPYGMYEIPMDGSTPARISSSGDVVPANFGAVYAGDRYFVIEGIATTLSSFITNYLYDPLTWEKITDFRGENVTAFDMAWNESTGEVYGYFHNFDTSDEYLGRINITTGQIEEIASLSVSLRGMSFDSEGILYAIDSEGGLYKVSTSGGELEKVGDTGCQSKWTTSGAINGSTRDFYYVTCNDESSDIYRIDLDTAASEYLGELADGMELAGLYFPDPAALPEAPSRPELSLLFPDGALAGDVVLKFPTLRFDGEVLSGSLTYNLWAGDELIGTGSGEPGESIRIPVSFETAGFRNFVAKVSNDVGMAPVLTERCWIGPDTPARLPYVDLTYDGSGTFTLTWPEAVAEHGGWYNADEVSYTVVRYGSSEKRYTGIRTTTFENKVSLPAEDEYATYHYDVIPYFGAVAGSSTSTEFYTIGSRVPPFVEHFDARWDLGKFTIFEGENKDNERWYYNATDKAVSLTTFTSNGGDDYLLLPPLMLQAGYVYPVSFRLKIKYASDTERIAVLAGTSPTVAGLNEVLLPPTGFTNTDYEDVEFEFMPSVSGSYFIAIHALSAPNQGGITIDDIEVGAGTVGVTQRLSTSGLRIIPGHGECLIQDGQGEEVEVYELSGKCVGRCVATGETHMTVAPGLYIVRAGALHQKVLISR